MSADKRNRERETADTTFSIVQIPSGELQELIKRPEGRTIVTDFQSIANGELSNDWNLLPHESSPAIRCYRNLGFRDSFSIRGRQVPGESAQHLYYCRLAVVRIITASLGFNLQHKEKNCAVVSQ